jgi:hypothetical protein
MLLGGGSLLLSYLDTLGADGPRAILVSSPRHLAETVPGRGTFREAVEATGTRDEKLGKLKVFFAADFRRSGRGRGTYWSRQSWRRRLRSRDELLWVCNDPRPIMRPKV